MALAADRGTPRRDNEAFAFAPAAGQVIHRGAIVCLDAAGALVRGAAATGLRCVGIATTGTRDVAHDGLIRVRRGCWRFENSAAADAIGLGDIGTTCFIADDDRVAKTHGGNTRSPCGVVRDVDAQGVWVEI